jgi:hypothetical protein
MMMLIMIIIVVVKIIIIIFHLTSCNLTDMDTVSTSPPAKPEYCQIRKFPRYLSTKLHNVTSKETVI